MLVTKNVKKKFNHIFSIKYDIILYKFLYFCTNIPIEVRVNEIKK